MCLCVMHYLILIRYPLEVADVDREDSATYALLPGAWRDECCRLEGLQPISTHNSSRRSKAQREYLSRYYCSSAGAVSWQERIVHPKVRT